MVNEGYAHIACSCGQKFQVLKETVLEDGTVTVDWDEAKTAAEYYKHTKECKV